MTSVLAFSSGIISAPLDSVFNLEGNAIGFGDHGIIDYFFNPYTDSSYQNPVDATSYAFTAPSNGVLRNLRACVDIYRPADPGAGNGCGNGCGGCISNTQQVHFQVEISVATNASVKDPDYTHTALFVVTDLTATVVFPATLVVSMNIFTDPNEAGFYTMCGSNHVDEVSIVSGDRVAMRVLVGVGCEPLRSISQVGFSAGLVYEMV